MRADTFTAILMLVFLVIILLVSPVIAYYSCHERWAGTYPAQWSLFVGCRVQINGKWVPEKNVREF